MIRRLKSELDFRVTLWVHPFASPFSTAAWREGKDGSSLWLKGFPWPSSWPAFIIWWEGLGAVLDVTSPVATSWYLGKLGDLQSKYGVDSFKFDAGESNLMPRWRHDASMMLDNPNEYTRLFVDMAYRSDAIRISKLGVGCPQLWGSPLAKFGCLGGATVRALDFRPSGRGFYSGSGRL